MKHQRIELSTGRVDVLDHAVPLHLCTRMNEYLTKDCGYFMGWADRNGQSEHLHAMLSLDNPWPREVLEEIATYPVAVERFEGFEPQKNVVNLSHQGSIHHVHAHDIDERVVLYYANLEWQDHYEGETMFFSSEGEVEFVSKYVPGRVLIFDGNIPHTIRAPSPAGPQFRLTVTWFMRKANEPTTET